MTPERRRRLSREELRSLLLDAGRTLLREEGLGTGAESLTFKRVFDRVEAETGIRLTNASIIRRVWENQAEFQSDVVVTIAGDEGLPELEETLAAIDPLVAGMDVSTPEARIRGMRELIRVAGAVNIEALRRSPNWSTWIGVWSLTTATAYPERDRVVSALAASYEALTAGYEEVYASLMTLLGLRPRNGLTLRQFTIAAGALAEGYSLRERVDGSDLQGIRLPSGPDGEERTWTLFSVGLDALAQRFFEIDPDWAPSVSSEHPS